MATKGKAVDFDGRHRVQGLVARPAVYVHANDTLKQVAQTLMEESIGASLVRGPHGVVGLVSERDLVRAIADGVSVTRTPVSDVMTTDLITAAPNDELLDVVHRMLDAEVRHLPIVEDGVAYGMVSARDALRVLANDNAHS
jgi:signal-transduction protein with cAMP-binding, CBS, and nucleotidyltransferase domain